ncbi:MAG TPA: glycosyltransferase, partial [Chthoniobacteraceae bacterium]|nr:glycosyltransferase [Chthoniobacteraceae bacterium]
MREFIPGGFPEWAFNPALIEWRGRMLMMYRCDKPENRGLFIGEVKADLEPLGDFRKVSVPLGDFPCQDPRFFIFKGRLHFSFVQAERLRQRVGIGLLDDDWTARDCRLIEHPAGQALEKNWIFFEHGGELYFTYSMGGGVHQVCRVNGGTCEPCYTTAYDASHWKWGPARGGTQLVAHGGLWHGFFHAALFDHEGLKRRYFMGAYAMAPEPPFSIVKWSRSPLYTPGESGRCAITDYSPGEIMAVIFPSGLVMRDGSWLVAAGYNDYFIRGFEISHAWLNENMVDATSHMAAAHSDDWLLHFPVYDPFWMNILDVAQASITPGQRMFSHSAFFPRFPGAQSYEHMEEKSLREADWIIFHKGYAEIVGLPVLRCIQQLFNTVFANEVFVLLARKELPAARIPFDPLHEAALWAEAKRLEAGPAWEPPEESCADAPPLPSPENWFPGDAGERCEIAVAICTHNALDYTQRCVASLARFAVRPYHVFIVDDLSTDGTREWLARQRAPGLTYHFNLEQQGVIGTRNRLIEMILPALADGGSVVFLDN